MLPSLYGNNQQGSLLGISNSPKGLLLILFKQIILVVDSNHYRSGNLTLHIFISPLNHELYAQGLVF
jgi:hypothetical protein